MVEASTVRKLLDTIEVRLGRLSSLSTVSFDEFRQDEAIQDRVERNFEVCIQACIDLGAHILADLPRVQPETYADVFRRLEEEEIITSDLSAELQKMAGFRNLLVHGYAELLAASVHANLSRLGDIQEYVNQLLPYLEKQGVL